MTPYQYVHNNPVNMIDPTGMEAKSTVERDDIIINNRDGNEIARIIVDTGDYDYVFNTNLSMELDEPITYDTGMTIGQLQSQFDAIGLNINASGTVGGGMEFGLSFAYFLNGESEGNLGIYASKGGNVGIGGGAGFSFFGSDFNKGADARKFFNASEFGGNYNALSAGVAGFGYSKTWSNEKNTHDEIYPGHRHTTTWTSQSLGYGEGPKSLSQILGKAGKASATYSGGTSTLIREFKSKKVKR